MRHRVQEGQCPWRHLQLPSHPQEENKPKLCRAWRADSGFPPHPFNEPRWRSPPILIASPKPSAWGPCCQLACASAGGSSLLPAFGTPGHLLLRKSLRVSS